MLSFVILCSLAAAAHRAVLEVLTLIFTVLWQLLHGEQYLEVFTLLLSPVFWLLLHGEQYLEVLALLLSPVLWQLLHGEQYLEVLSPLPTSGTLLSQLTVEDVLDKGSGALMVIRSEWGPL